MKIKVLDLRIETTSVLINLAIISISQLHLDIFKVSFFSFLSSTIKKKIIGPTHTPASDQMNTP